LLLVHGWGADRRSWDDIVALVSPWADVVSPDLAGHGERTGDCAPGARFTVDNLAADLATRISDGERVVAIGHSMGGQVVAKLAIRCPDRIRAVGVIDPAYGADDAEIERCPEVLADLRQRGSQAGVEFVDRAFAGSTATALHRAARDQMSRTPGPVLSDLYESMYLAPGSIGARPATRAFLPTIGRPCLSLYSTEYAASFARSVTWRTGSAVEVWPGTTHYLHQEQPARFAEFLRRWLNRT
jgi:pimeloyl-ACP methyl ester carboxylesterase